MKNAPERQDRAKQGANGPREAATGEVPDDLWQFVPLSDYHPPRLPVRGADARWLEIFSAVGDLWLLPNLERCYLRHAQGFALVRRLLEAAESGHLGRGLIACDSWAWAYLQHVWPSTRSDALTLQAFDGCGLKNLLTALTVSARSRTVCYRNAKSGEAILTVPADEKEEASAELIQLACHCRGNVGLALEYWRTRLRTEPELDASQPEARKEIKIVAVMPIDFR